MMNCRKTVCTSSTTDGLDLKLDHMELILRMVENHRIQRREAEMIDAQCPVCDAGTLTETPFENVIEFRGQSRVLMCRASTCSACEVVQAGAEQMSLNKDDVLSFYAEVDYGAQAAKMSPTLLRARYERSASPHGTAKHLWTTKIARLPGRNRLPRGLYEAQVFV